LCRAAVPKEQKEGREGERERRRERGEREREKLYKKARLEQNVVGYGSGGGRRKDTSVWGDKKSVGGPILESVRRGGVQEGSDQGSGSQEAAVPWEVWLRGIKGSGSCNSSSSSSSRERSRGRRRGGEVGDRKRSSASSGRGDGGDAFCREGPTGGTYWQEEAAEDISRGTGEEWTMAANKKKRRKR
jgi:hypothetical protein